MDKELKAKWIAALRGGEYQQGKNYLFMNGRYCCLGVICNVITGSEPPMAWNEMRPDNLAFIKGYRDKNHERRLETIENELVKMNDGGKSFTEIADWIEANL